MNFSRKKISCVMAAAATMLPVAAQQPRMVVGIIVEGLTADDLELYATTNTGGGFNHIASQGVAVTDVDYLSDNPTASLATLMTGATPRVSGIDSDTGFDRDTHHSISALFDGAYMGNFTPETMSPANIKVSTLGDELRAATSGRSRIYSIAPTAEMAIVAGGHAASSALWINDVDGRWSTSTYYKDTPSIVAEHNYRRPLSQRLDTISWSGGKGATAYRYNFLRKDIDRYRRFKSSPRVNDEVTMMASDLLRWMWRSRGADEATDMVTLVYSLQPYPYATNSASEATERADAYRRLDANIRRLLVDINATVGLDNTLVYVAGLPGEHLGRPYDERWGIPAGEFSPRKAKGLLNMYLMAMYGNGEWVSGTDNTRFYLNSNLAQERGLEMSRLRREAADFLARMSGVSGAFTTEEILADTQRRNLFHTPTLPDILVEVNPGWRLVETDNPRIEGKSVTHSSMANPLFILYPPLAQQRIDTPQDARTIAPTLARLMRIRAPNGASLPPLRPGKK